MVSSPYTSPSSSSLSLILFYLSLENKTARTVSQRKPVFKTKQSKKWKKKSKEKKQASKE